MGINNSIYLIFGHYFIELLPVQVFVNPYRCEGINKSFHQNQTKYDYEQRGKIY